MKERFRDKTRDNLAYGLNLLGVHAELAERGRPEENIQKPAWMRSLGVIDLHEGPIRWINIVKRDGSQYSAPEWRLVLCIPDQRNSPFGPLSLRTTRHKAFPQFWKVTRIEWDGDDYGTGLLAHLRQDPAVTRLVAKVGDLEIQRCSNEFEGWTLQVKSSFTRSMSQWSILTAIAERLLEIPSGL